MRFQTPDVFICILLGAILWAVPLQAEETFAHADWATVLERHVDGKGLVDYRALSRDRRALDRYVAAVNAVSPETAPERFPTRNHELAYYINAYNALVFAGVLSRGPHTISRPIRRPATRTPAPAR